MTIELRNFAKNRIEYLIKISPFVFDEPDREALEMAIQALSQEPCDDAISREAVIEWLENATYEDISYAVGTELSFLPPVTPKLETVTEFADRCRECGARYGKLLKQKSGQWDRLYSWLNDMRLGIAPDETVTDIDERNVRTAQVDLLDEIIEWMAEPQESEE